MQGMGFMQIQSLTLSNDEDQFEDALETVQCNYTYHKSNHN